MQQLDYGLVPSGRGPPQRRLTKIILRIDIDLAGVEQQLDHIAILVVEYPTNWIIQRVPIAKYLSLNICLWGTILALHAVAKNFTHIVVLRTLLGIFEATCQPAFIVLSSMWYRREEQAAVVTYWLVSPVYKIETMLTKPGTL